MSDAEENVLDIDDGARELLERAKRLCMAASQIEIPVFNISMPKINWKDSEQEEEEEQQQQSIVPSIKQKEKPKKTKKKSKSKPIETPTPSIDNNKSNHQDSKNHVQKKQIPKVNNVSKSIKKAKPLVTPCNLSPEKVTTPRIDNEERKKQDQAKAKYAQERAAARIARQLELERQEIEKVAAERQQKSVLQKEQMEEMERKLEENRIKAEERAKERAKAEKIKQQKEKEAMLDTKKHHDPAQVEAFHKKTLERLKMTSVVKEVPCVDEEKNEPQKKHHSTNQELSEAEILERQEKEKQRRIETEKRLKRLKKLEEEQEKKEQERRQQQLANYMNRKKELDKVAKGLNKPKSISKDVHKHTTQFTPYERESPLKPCLPHEEEDDFQMSNSPEKDEMIIIEEPESELQPFIEPVVNDNISNETVLQNASEDVALIQEGVLPHKLSAEKTKQKHRRLPPWKQPPVPIPSAQLLIPKVVVNGEGSPKNYQRACVTANTSESYMQKFKTRSLEQPRAFTSSSHAGSRVVDATRQRAIELSKIN